MQHSISHRPISVPMGRQTHQNSGPYWSIRISIEICVIPGHRCPQTERNCPENNQSDSVDDGTAICGSATSKLSKFPRAAKITNRLLLLLLLLLLPRRVRSQLDTSRHCEWLSYDDLCHDDNEAKCGDKNRQTNK